LIKKKQVNMRIPQELWLNFKEECEKNNTNVTEVLRGYITYYCSRKTLERSERLKAQDRGDLREAWLPPEQRKGGR
jgi:hypothetical protein